MKKMTWKAAHFSILVIAMGLGACTHDGSIPTSEPKIKSEEHPDRSLANERFVKRGNPDRIEVYAPDKSWLATFTTHSYTVSMHGPKRRFAEASTRSTVESSVWVRTLAQPFKGEIDEAWLKDALKMNDAGEADILALAFQYGPGAQPLFDKQGLQIAGDASYGPESSEGRRAKGSDVLDYLGENVPTLTQRSRSIPRAQRLHSLDCSGYMRMIWGYRNKGVEISKSKTPEVGSSPLLTLLPRTSDEMARKGPGIVLPVSSDHRDFSRLQVGDILFFDAHSDDGQTIDHVALFLGKDSDGHYRFVSSRKSSDGPTMGDTQGPSILDGEGHFARAFRSARRF